MKNDIHCWAATFMRGVLALFVGSAVMIVPDMAQTLLLLPFAVTISILCLAAYGVLDSVIVFTTSFMAASPRARIALRLQGTVGAVLGVLLSSFIFAIVRLHWFLYLVGFQALCTSGAEFIVARHASTKGTSIWNYSAATIALLSGTAYMIVVTMFGSNLLPRTVALLVFGYLIAFGMAQCLTAARMLYADREAGISAEVREL